MMNRRIYQGIQVAYLASNFLLPLPVFAGSGNAENTPKEEVQRFSDTIYLIKDNYVNAVKDSQLFDSAISGMIKGLDPQSSLIAIDNNSNAENLNQTGDIGIELTMDNDVVKVITPLLDGPAFKAGIKPGDYIIKLDNKSTQGLSIEETAKIFRGEQGSAIKLVILRKGEEKPLSFNLLREKMQAQSVKAKLVDKQFAYISLSQFQSDTGNEMSKAINALQEQAGGKLSGLVLDLRYNPGGLLDSAIEVADAFLDNTQINHKMLIVRTEGRIPNLSFTAYARPGDVLNQAPIVVLINNGSSSAAEVVAGALKDNKRAVIIGTKSFGKGSVQTVLPLDDKRSIKLTTALYYTPAGVSIQEKAITPDIFVQDMHITKNKQKNERLGLTEADLKDHLINDKHNLQSNEIQANQDSEALLYEDYQLYTALTILKSASINRLLKDNWAKVSSAH